MTTEVLWLALALVFIVEGLLPFFAPGLWQRIMQQIAQQAPSGLRLMGFISIALGLLMLWLR